VIIVTTPPEDLVLAARAIDPNVLDAIARVSWDEDELTLDWRIHVPPSLRKLWGRLGLEARLAVYLTAQLALDDPHTFDE
jgi:hypothetical protein